jgi:hypothetical protein
MKPLTSNRLTSIFNDALGDAGRPARAPLGSASLPSRDATKPDGSLSQAPANIYKGVDYCYPSSPAAERFGHTRDGCWAITIYRQDAQGNLRSKMTTTAYTDKHAAYAAAAQMSEPWGYVWRRYSRHAIARAEGVEPDDIYPRPKVGEHYQ